MEKKSKKTLLFIALLIIASFLLMTFLGTFKKEPQKKPKKVVKRFVKVSEVKYSDISSEIEEFGRVISLEKVDILSEVRGKIESGNVPLKKGQRFKRGDILLKVYDKEAKLALKAKKSRFLNLIANLLADFKIDFPERFDRWKEFFDSISIDKILPDMPETKSKNEKIFLASRNILSEFYSIKMDEVVLKKYTIFAPFSGSYTSVMMEVGSIANPGAPIAKAIRTDRMEIEVPIDSKGVKWVKLGDKVDIEIDKGRGIVQEGKVVRVSPFIDQGTHSVAVFIGFENITSDPLFSGDYLKVIFSGIIISNGMKIARNAVFNNNEVFLVKDNKLKKTEINVLKLDAKIIIFNGLEEGELLVVEPLINARDGSPVEPRR
ncbi:MAG: efflux RND transporter periplasmic adaptor subunit [Candidatus Aminicenantes bacterium]|nr:efflux RND transporter periplasmic adaptor subunit [Candidatus Aminicenantes bacterium]